MLRLISGRPDTPASENLDVTIHPSENSIESFRSEACEFLQSVSLPEGIRRNFGGESSDACMVMG